MGSLTQQCLLTVFSPEQGSNPRSHNTFSQQVSLVSFHLEQFLTFIHLLSFLALLKNCQANFFIECSPIWIVWCFLMMSFRLHILEGISWFTILRAQNINLSITGGSHLIKVVSTRYSHQVSIFLVVFKVCCKEMLECIQIFYFLIKHSPINPMDSGTHSYFPTSPLPLFLWFSIPLWERVYYLLSYITVDSDSYIIQWVIIH